MSENAEPKGPDFTQGVDPATIPDYGMLGGRVGDAPVLLARVEGKLVAIGARCTHYDGPLEEGLRVGATVRCPWHQACFDLRTGAALEAPALAPVDRWKVEEADGKVFVKEKAPPEPRPRRAASSDPKAIAIVGGGAAGFAAAQRLRDLGYDGELTLLSADAAAPYDRPNLSKDYLAGKADPAWLPLKDEGFYGENRIDLRLSAKVDRIDPQARELALEDGGRLAFDRLLLATGARPNRPDIPGFDRGDVFTLRSRADSDAIIAAASGAKTVAILGASFIGLEAAWALLARGLEVVVAAPEELPLAAKLGEAFGRAIRRLHASHGVRFHLGRKAAGFDGKTLSLDDGTKITADFVVAGVGVAPRVGLAEAAGLETHKGVIVDACLRTSTRGVFAAGDIARFPDPAGGAPIRVEHWKVAERHGQIAAANMLGIETPVSEPPFFWSAHYDDSIHYVGHAERWDRLEIDGDLEARDATVRYFVGERLAAAATIGRDFESLELRARLG
jgi:NADPH-dependent 2,4-dienoyl-CoA reductase/sulfur reductase-like enzyme/nitrite reductase/ring-hydroxylating ferredoxin subunit